MGPDEQATIIERFLLQKDRSVLQREHHLSQINQVHRFVCRNRASWSLFFENFEKLIYTQLLEPVRREDRFYNGTLSR